MVRGIRLGGKFCWEGQRRIKSTSSSLEVGRRSRLQMIGRWVGNPRRQDERTWVGAAYHAGKSQRRRRAPYKNQLGIWRKGLISLQVFSSFCQLSSILVFVSSSPCKMKDHQSRSILLNLGPFNHIEAYDWRLNTGSRRVIFRIPDMLCFFFQLQYAKFGKIREDQSSKGNHWDSCLHLEHRPHQIFVYTIVVIQTHFCSIKRVASKTKGHNFLGT